MPRQTTQLGHRAALALSGHGPVAAVGLAVLLGIIAAGICLPRQAIPAVLALAMLTAAALWLAQGLGGVLTGMGTDPASGPLLALVALAFWPRPVPMAATGTAVAAATQPDPERASATNPPAPRPAGSAAPRPAATATPRPESPLPLTGGRA